MQEDVIKVAKVARSATNTVRAFPFFYAVALILFWIVAPMLDYDALTAIDSLIFLSAAMVALLIRLSYCVKLCKWHRLQCSLPLLPQIVDKIDVYIYEFGTYLAIINYAVLGVIAVLSLVNAYFVFMKPLIPKWKARRRSALYPRR